MSAPSYAAERCKPSEQQKPVRTACADGKGLAAAVRQNENPAWAVSGSIHVRYGGKRAAEKEKRKTGFDVQSVSQPRFQQYVSDSAAGAALSAV